MRALQAQGERKVVLGMVHLPPLPGTPLYESGSLERITETAAASARALREGGADGCLIQTVDRVYSPRDESDPARTSAMALIVQAVARATGGDFPVGVQLMRNALKASLAVAKVAGGTFIRAGAIVGATVTAHGVVEAEPLDVMEYRAKIAARDVAVVADVASTQFSWLGGDKSVAEVARAARLVGADAVALGDPDDDATLEIVAAVRAAAPGLPIVLSGHTHHGNAARLLAEADGAFVGSCLERGGWGGEIDADRVRDYVSAVRAVEATR